MEEVHCRECVWRRAAHAPSATPVRGATRAAADPPGTSPPDAPCPTATTEHLIREVYALLASGDTLQAHRLAAEALATGDPDRDEPGVAPVRADPVRARLLCCLAVAEADPDRAAAHLTRAAHLWNGAGQPVEEHPRTSREAPEGWHRLTRAERLVADQVAQGLTNTQVASRLQVSPHTVNFHLRNVFRKLAIASRVELARMHGRFSPSDPGSP